MKVFYLFIVLLLLSCKNEQKSTPVKPAENTIKSTETSPQQQIAFDSLTTTQPEVLKALLTGKTENGVTLFFQQFFVKIDSLAVNDPDQKLRDKQEETVFIPVNTGAHTGNKKVEILQDQYDRIAVFQRFENNLFITNNQGAVCDLTKWKSYLSEWKQLPVTKNTFYLYAYPPKARKLFEKIRLSAFKNAVKEQCGPSFFQKIQSVKTKKDLQKYIQTDKIYLKIILENSKTGNRSEKLIIFELPVK